MYDNPTYISGHTCTEHQVGSVLGGDQEVVYQQPHTTAREKEAEYQQPVFLDSGVGVEETVYRKLINPLYHSQTSSLSNELRLQPPTPHYCNADNDPSYATPSFCDPHSHTNMECQSEPSRDVCSHNYESVEKM